jgi:hypothetical protein
MWDLQALPRLSQDEGEPVFAEPWQAQAFALAVKLSEQGHFTWQEWAAALTSELKAPFRRTALISAAPPRPNRSRKGRLSDVALS